MCVECNIMHDSGWVCSTYLHLSYRVVGIDVVWGACVCPGGHGNVDLLVVTRPRRVNALSIARG
jgi:hypothetical protein